jgi:hypothetical protein
LHIFLRSFNNYTIFFLQLLLSFQSSNSVLQIFKIIDTYFWKDTTFVKDTNAYVNVVRWLHSFLISKLDRDEWSELCVSAFTLVGISPVLIKQEAGWVQNRSGRFGKEKIPLPLPGIES